MKTRFTRALGQRWQSCRELPFARLVRLFTARIFRGSGDSDSEGMDLSVGLILTLLALPGGFISVILFPKYGTLLQWMRGVINSDPIAVSLPDEYFFVALSMAVTSAVAVWRWDSIFPDRRDYLNLAPLPISSRTILLANLTAVTYFAALVALVVNAASSILFPLAVGSTQTTFIFFARFAAAHALDVTLASAFAFFAVLAVLGLFMAILPWSLFARISPYLRTLIVIASVTLLSTSFAVPAWLTKSLATPNLALGSLPPLWFLGFGMSLLGKADANLAALGRLALPALGSTVLLALAVYSAGCRKHFMRIPESADAGPAIDRPRLRWLRKINAVVMRSSPRQACSLFIWKTLFRSEPHRLLLAGFGGLGLVVASQALLRASSPSSLANAPGGAVNGQLSPDILSIPLILIFFLVAALRLAFEIPVDLRANWIFRLLLDSEKENCEDMARRLILMTVLPGVLLIVLPVYCFLVGWVAGILHTALVALWSILLTDAALVRFHKMPFTCSFPLFQQHSIVTFLACALAFFVFAVLTPEFESWALEEPFRMLILIPIATIAWYIPHRIRQNALAFERALIFDELPARDFEILRIAE